MAAISHWYIDSDGGEDVLRYTSRFHGKKVILLLIYLSAGSVSFLMSGCNGGDEPEQSIAIISVCVTEDDGSPKPLEGVEVTFENLVEEENPQTVKTDSDGKRHQINLQTGDHKITALLDGYQKYEEIETIEVSMDPIQIRLRRLTVNVSGLVTDRKTERGLGDVIVSFDNQSVETDDKGRYRIEVTLGEHRLIMVSEGYFRLEEVVEVSDEKKEFDRELEPIVNDPEDKTPPQTTDNAPEDENWQPQPFRLILTATDNLSGVKATHYTVDGSQPTQNSPQYAGPIQLNGDRQRLVKYFSVDVAGNVEPVKTAIVKVDTTPPDAPFVQDEGDAVKEARLVFQWNPVDDISGIAEYELEVATERTFDADVIITPEPVLVNQPQATITTDNRITITGCTTYYARVRAQNGANLWSEWSEPTDGIAVDLPATAILIVNGRITRLGLPAPDELEVIIALKRGNRTINSRQTTVGKEGVPGVYTETFVDFDTSCAATVGDIIEVSVTERGTEVGQTSHNVSLVDLEDHNAVIDVSVR